MSRKWEISSAETSSGTGGGGVVTDGVRFGVFFFCCFFEAVGEYDGAVGGGIGATCRLMGIGAVRQTTER